jgi:hypothetical protein
MGEEMSIDEEREARKKWMNEMFESFLLNKMPWLFMNGRLMNPNNLPSMAQYYKDAFEAGFYDGETWGIKNFTM